MNLTEWLIFAFSMAGASFISGIGVRLAGELIDYIKKKRHHLQDMILNNNKINDKRD